MDTKKTAGGGLFCCVCFRREKTHRVWEDPLLEYKIPDNFGRIMFII